MNASISKVDMAYAYALGLVSGLQGRILKPSDYETMMQAGGVREIISSLEGTVYGEGFRKLRVGYSLQDIEEAIASYFRKSYVEVASAVPEQDSVLLDSLILGGWDVDNIKTVARAVRTGAGGEDLLSMLFPYGRLGRERLSALASSSSVEEMAGRLPEPYSLYFGKALSRRQGQLEFEEELDRNFILDLLLKSGGDIRDYLRLSVDTLNVRTILRCTAYGVEPGRHVINEGYHITPNKLQQLLRQDVQGIIKVLEDTPYCQAVKDSLHDGEGWLANIDTRLKAVLAREVEYNAILKPLSVNSVIAYIRRREAEARNIRAILAGKWYGLGAEEMEKMIS
jgi:vacuolar-type H+-ATPase subunit C/Vma6